MPIRLFGILLLFFSPGLVFASEIMFEGYYRIELENKPIGYTILRFAFDPKTNSFESESFLRAKFGDKLVQESLKAKCTDKFQPISYQYTNAVGDQIKMIDAEFKGQIEKVKINDGKKLRTETYKDPKGTFLATFLPYLMLQQKLTLNEAFKYSAVAEEDGGSYWGKTWLQSKETRPGYDLFTVVNRYQGKEFTSKMAVVHDPKNPDKNIKGEVFFVDMPSQNVTMQLVASPVKATEGQLVPNKTLMTVFGNIPTGKMNLIASPPDVEMAVKKSTPGG